MRGLTNTSGEVSVLSDAPAATTAAVVTIPAIAGEFRTVVAIMYGYDTSGANTKSITIVSGSSVSHTLRLRQDGGIYPVVPPFPIRG